MGARSHAATAPAARTHRLTPLHMTDLEETDSAGLVIAARGLMGVGAAIMMPTLGVALLGSLLAEGYSDRLDVTGLPDQAAEAAQESIAGAIAVATRLGEPALAVSANDAYLHGMTLVLVATAIAAALSAAVVGAFLTGRPTAHQTHPTPAVAVVEEEER